MNSGCMEKHGFVEKWGLNGERMVEEWWKNGGRMVKNGGRMVEK